MSEKTYKDELKEIVEKFEKKELTKDQAFDQVIDIYKKEGTEAAEDVNAALKKLGVGLSFQPGKQIITPEQVTCEYGRWCCGCQGEWLWYAGYWHWFRGEGKGC